MILFCFSVSESQFIKRATTLIKQSKAEMDLLKKTLTETRRKNTLLIMQLKQLQQSMFLLNHVTVL